MFLREQLVLLATIALTLPTLSASPITPPKNRLKLLPASRPKALDLPGVEKLNELQKAYLDSYSILSRENSCSKFFSGPAAIVVLNGFVQQVQTTWLSRDISMRMRGQPMMFLDLTTGLSYRLFKTVEVNLNGPFYQG